MRICHFDPFSGISGDMTVGALIDAGADPAILFDTLSSLGTEATFTVEQTKRKGIGASKFKVEGGLVKGHRHLPEIQRMINGSKMSDKSKQTALLIFDHLAKAESHIHRTPIEKVHFHEVGAVDSICDIAGAAIALDLLQIDQVTTSAINTGCGTVKADHGVMPVPAPATALLLEGMPVYARGPETELTTPTGAAILAALARSFGPMPAAKLLKTGYGAGDKDFPQHANVLRVILAEKTNSPESTAVSIIESNIDDSTAEVLGFTMERLFAQGALDVSYQPLHMKKNRPGTLLRVIARPEDQEKLAETVFTETSTLGLRIYHAERRVRERHIQEIDLGYGKVRVKVTSDGASPEFDDCRSVAIDTGKPLRQVLVDALRKL